MVETYIKHRHMVQLANLRRNATREIIIEQDNLIQRRPHPADARRNAPAQLIVGKNNHGHRRVAQVLRDPIPQPVGIQENGVQRAVE